jgi:hypothetical protein
MLIAWDSMEEKEGDRTVTYSNAGVGGFPFS